VLILSIMKKNLNLKKVTSGDRIYFKKWWYDKELIDLTSRIYEPLSEKSFGKFFHEMIENQNSYYFMIVYDDKKIGNVSLIKIKKSVYEIQVVIGEKKYWGLGVGTNVINKVIKILKKQGASKIRLQVRIENIRAQKAYEKCGFLEVSRDNEHILMELLFR